MNDYSDYDRFAWVYNRHWGQGFTEQVFPVLENLVLRQLTPGAKILDLCCGTGQLARVLSASGYQVTGLDKSEEMLRFARDNAPTTEFILSDARYFELPDIFQAVLSTFDSLNHIMSLRELETVFGNVHHALRPGGLFLFDLNMEGGYLACWHDSFGVVEDNLVCVVRTSYHPEERTAQFDATVFHLQDGWQRSDVTLRQKCHSPAEVQSALEKAGFKETQAYAFDEQKGLGELTKEAERAFFLCRKP